MALIKCPECGSKVSEWADVCPGCGFPIKNHDPDLSDYDFDEDRVVDLIDDSDPMECPDFPLNMQIGDQVSDSVLGNIISGTYNEQLSSCSKISSGRVAISLHTHGISVVYGIKGNLEINNMQIISIRTTSAETIIEKSKSPIGRALLGKWLFGDTGAIVGAISGIGTTTKSRVSKMLFINFWDPDNCVSETIVLNCDGKQPCEEFIQQRRKEMEINLKENRLPQQMTFHMSLKGWLFIISIALVIFCIFYAIFR